MWWSRSILPTHSTAYVATPCLNQLLRQFLNYTHLSISLMQLLQSSNFLTFLCRPRWALSRAILSVPFSFVSLFNPLCSYLTLVSALDFWMTLHWGETHRLLPRIFSISPRLSHLWACALIVRSAKSSLWLIPTHLIFAGRTSNFWTSTQYLCSGLHSSKGQRWMLLFFNIVLISKGPSLNLVSFLLRVP